MVIFYVGIERINMKIDNEYSTSNLYEMKELKRCGIRYTFVKIVEGNTVWKYKKTSRLFEVLKNFYINNEFVGEDYVSR